MSTRPNILLPAGEWVDLNAALTAQAGFPAVTVGTALNIKLESSGSIKLCEKATEPTDSDGYRSLSDSDIPVGVTNDVGTWAFAVGSNCTINVEV